MELLKKIIKHTGFSYIGNGHGIVLKTLQCHKCSWAQISYGNTWDFLEPKQISLFCKNWDWRCEPGLGTEVSAFRNRGMQSTQNFPFMLYYLTVPKVVAPSDGCPAAVSGS